MRAWSLTDGTPEREESCLAVAEAVADRVERRRVWPRALFRFMPVWRTIDPRDAPERGYGPIAPRVGDPWPALIVASGKVAAPYLARVKKASGGRSLAVFLGQGAPASADLVAALGHEHREGGARLVIGAPPHRIDPVRVAAARGGPSPFAGEGARVAVLIGEGPGKRGMAGEDVARLAAGVRKLRLDGATIAVRAPRNVPRRSLLALAEVAHHIWDGEGPDPLLPLMAHADAIVTAATSARIVSESLATGAPVHVFMPASASSAVCSLVSSLAAGGVVRPFAGAIEGGRAPALDSTRDIARAIDAILSTRAALKPRAGAAAPRRQRETNGPTSR